jgi:hypothetical protein
MAARLKLLTDGAGLMVPLKDWAAVCPALSFTCRVKLYAPDAAGVPLME